MHVKPPPIPLIKNNYDEKLDKYCVKIKLLRDPTSEKSDINDFKMDLFDNFDPEGLLLFVRNLTLLSRLQ